MATPAKKSIGAGSKAVRTRPTRRKRASVEGYRVEQQVGHLLRRAHQRHTALFAQQIGPAGFTPTQWAAVFKLRELGSASQNQLSRMTAIDVATMQGLIQRLIQRGIVVQKPDAQDKRRSRVKLTRAGAAFVDACVPHAARITQLTLAPLTPDQKKLLVKLLRLLS